MPLSGMGVRRASWTGGVSPTVSASANGEFNAQETPIVAYAGVRFNSNGNEYETAGSGWDQTGVGGDGVWLDSGNASDVWVEWNRVSGDLNFSDLDPGSSRLNLGTTRSWRHRRSSVGSDTITGNFDFWDAASGGNNLQTTSNATWTATVTFNPCPICCFTADTLVTMADGLEMRIADVKVGDKILTVTDDLMGTAETEVTEVIVRVDRPMHLIHFTNGTALEASEDHPLYIKGKGWASVNPDPRTDYKDIGIPKMVEVGDTVFMADGSAVHVRKIDKLDYPDAVFTFAESRWFANGILVY